MVMASQTHLLFVRQELAQMRTFVGGAPLLGLTPQTVVQAFDEQQRAIEGLFLRPVAS